MLPWQEPPVPPKLINITRPWFWAPPKLIDK